jgi:uncharacterized membrane protein
MSTGERSIGVVLQDILTNLQEIVRAEVRLAKTEVRSEIKEARAATSLLGIGVILGIVSICLVFASLVCGLLIVLPPWAATLVGAVAAAVIAAILFAISAKRYKALRAMPKTVATLKENLEWMKQHAK